MFVDNTPRCIIRSLFSLMHIALAIDSNFVDRQGLLGEEHWSSIFVTLPMRLKSSTFLHMMAACRFNEYLLRHLPRRSGDDNEADLDRRGELDLVILLMAAMRGKIPGIGNIWGSTLPAIETILQAGGDSRRRYHEVSAWDMARADRHSYRARGYKAEVSRFDAILELFEQYNGKAQPQRRGNKKHYDNPSHQDEDEPGPGTDTQLTTHTGSTDDETEILGDVRQKKRSGKEYPRRKDNSDIGGSKGSPESQGSRSESSGEDDFD